MDNIYYHYHRLGDFSEIWQPGKYLSIDDSFVSGFYENILKRIENFQEYFPEYHIDQVIEAMELMKKNEDSINKNYHGFDACSNGYYMLRRELALEEGRILYNKNAPSRLHTVYLTDKDSLFYWYRYLGGESRIFEVEAQGNIFESSDYLFPDISDPLEKQIEDSKNYWQPKNLSYKLPKEYLFQGNLKIKGDYRL